MIIEAVEIAGYGPLQRPYKASFVRENCLIGINGGGKTTLLRAIAGVCGIDEATMLVAGHPVEHFYLRIKDGSTTYVFETRGRFVGAEIARFKNTLPERASFPITEWSEHFTGRCVDTKDARENFQHYASSHGSEPLSKSVFYSPKSRSVQWHSGDGFKTMLWTLLCDAPEGVPLLLDTPGMHLDLQGKRRFIDLLTNNDRQLIYSTHCPEMMLHDAAIGGIGGRNKNQAVIEVCEKNIEPKQKSS